MVSIEGALIAAPFMMLVLAIFEGGLLLSTIHGLGNSVRGGARAASVWGNEPTADYEILQAVKKSSAGMINRDITVIVVYKSDSTGAQPTATCRGGTAVANVCNVYSTGDLSRPSSDFGCKNAGQLDSNFCPSARKVALTAATGGPPDYVGVWISANHHTVSGLVGKTKTVTDRAVVQLEPRHV